MPIFSILVNLRENFIRLNLQLVESFLNLKNSCTYLKYFTDFFFFFQFQFVFTMAERTKRISRWYFGGLASAGAACCTHPLDLLKVHLQTAGKEKASLVKSTTNIIRNQGVLALYNGLSASLMRQLTYSTTRFGIYDVSSVIFYYY